MSRIQDVERVQFRMERIRRHLNEDVDRLQADAAQLMDWKYYIRRHPIASLAGVAVAGYFLVPKPTKTVEKKVYLDPDTSRHLLEKSDRVRIEDDDTEQAEAAKQGVLASLAVLAGNALLKAGIAYASQQLRSTWLSDFTRADPHHRETAHD